MMISERPTVTTPTRLIAVLALASIIALAPFAAGQSPNEKRIETKITTVSVYGNLAQVQRSVRVEVEPGAYRLLCDDLPPTFVETSLQVEGEGTAKARILGIDVVTRHGVQAETRRAQELGAKQERLLARKDSLGIVMQSVNARRDFITALGQYPFGKDQGEDAAGLFRIADWKTLMDFLQAERTAVDLRGDRLGKELKKINEEIASIAAEMKSMAAAGESKKRIAIECEVASSGFLDLNLSYVVPNASWRPEYSVRYDTSQERLELTYHARIQQATGEDWQAVSVVLSTARPQVGAAPPELQPYYLQKAGYVMRAGELYTRGGRSDEMKLELENYALEAADAAASNRAPAAAMPAPIAQLTAEAAGGAFATNLVIPKPVDLESGANPHRVMILREEMAGEIRRTSTPRLSPHVFVLGSFQNALAVPILGGAAEVYIETPLPGGLGRASNFVGTESIAAVVPGEPFDLHLGIDQDLKIEHKRLAKERLTKQGAKRTKFRYSYLITLESFKSADATVIVQDRIPVSLTKDIAIDDVEFEPRPDEQKDDGTVTWNLDLVPGGKQEIRIAYTVVFPAEWSENMINLE
jgi:uncharacterized protein (TIGR02231 family)